MFSSEGELKEIAAGVALKGIPAEEVMERLRGVYRLRREALDSQYQTMSSELTAGIEDVRRKITDEEESSRAVKTEIQDYRREQSTLAAKANQLDASIASNLQELRKIRFTHGKDYFQHQGEVIDSELEKTHKEILEDIKNRNEIAEEVYKFQKKYWQEDKEEFDRRAELFQKELNQVDNQLGIARNRAQRLQELGITRTTANFLIWVGYISLAGIGGVIGSFLQKRQDGQTDFLSLIFQGFMNLVKVTQPEKSAAGSGWILLAPLPLLALVITYLLVVGLVILGMDFVLKKFDPNNWGKRERKRSLRDRSSLLDRFSSYIPTPDVNRTSYRQLLAYFPYVVLAALIIWAFSVGIQGIDKQSVSGQKTPADPTLGLAATYLGVIFTLISTSVALLYATKIIEPRWLKYQQKGGKSNFDKYLKLNWEFFFLLLLLIISLLVAAVVPVGEKGATLFGGVKTEQYNNFVWGIVTLFMCLSSLGLAYGLIQRGLFRSVDYLERKRQVYRLQVEKNKVGPTLFDIRERYEPSDELKALVTNYREARYLMDEYRMLYELKEIFDTDFDDDRVISKYFNKLRPNSTIRLKDIRLRVPDGEPRPIDYIIAPLHTASILNNRVERRHAQERLAVIEGELRRLGDELIGIKNRLERLNQEATIRRRRKLDIDNEYARKKSSLKEREEKDLLKFQVAYGVGQIARTQLKDEMTPPPAPPAPPPPINDVESPIN